MPFVKEKTGGVVLRIHVQPNAKRNEVIGLHGDSLKIKIKAVPEDGRANAELIAFLAKLLDRPKSALSLESGQTSRSKAIFVSGITVAKVREMLAQSTIV